MKSKIRWINVALRALMEAGMVLGLGYWGYFNGTTTVTKIIMAISFPLVGFGFWGAVDFRNMGRLSEPLRLVQELIVSGLGAFGFYISGPHRLAWVLGLLIIVHHLLVYALGDTLLKK